MKVLVTGAAGFIGYHVVKALVNRGDKVVGIDNINDYYDQNLKYGRLLDCGIESSELKDSKSIQSNKYANFTFLKVRLEDAKSIKDLFEEEKFDHVIHLAAQAGVRYSLENPHAYIESNIVGFVNILEACRQHEIAHLTYASSSSVYGLNESMPFSTKDNVDHPISLYAATKKSNELMAHTYSYLYDLPTTGLRFFTAYGPWGRPDMAYFLFVDAILKGEPIRVFNNGEMSRDFTYINDIVEGVIRVNDSPPKNSADGSQTTAPYKVYNIGNNAPVKLMDFIEIIEKELGVEAQKELMPMQPGDVAATYADVSDLMSDFGYKPKTNLEYGVKQFISWYKEFYHVK